MVRIPAMLLHRLRRDLLSPSWSIFSLFYVFRNLSWIIINYGRKNHVWILVLSFCYLLSVHLSSICLSIMEVAWIWTTVKCEGGSRMVKRPVFPTDVLWEVSPRCPGERMRWNLITPCFYSHFSSHHHQTGAPTLETFSLKYCAMFVAAF